MDTSGNWRWLETILTNFIDDDAFKGILANSRDLTKQWEFQLKLEQSEARYRRFFESQSNYVVKTDLEGKYTYANKKFLGAFGWMHPEGILGETCFQSICDYHHAAVFEVVQLSTRLIQQLESSFWVIISSAFLVIPCTMKRLLRFGTKV